MLLAFFHSTIASRVKVEEVELQLSLLRSYKWQLPVVLGPCAFKSQLSTCTVEMDAGFQQGWMFVLQLIGYRSVAM